MMGENLWSACTNWVPKNSECPKDCPLFSESNAVWDDLPACRWHVGNSMKRQKFDHHGRQCHSIDLPSEPKKQWFFRTGGRFSFPGCTFPLLQKSMLSLSLSNSALSNRVGFSSAGCLLFPACASAYSCKQRSVIAKSREANGVVDFHFTFVCIRLACGHVIQAMPSPER